MKKIITTFIFAITLTISGFAAGEERDCPMTDYQTYHENGNIRMDGHINCENQFHGTFIEYREDGTVWGYGEYANGVRTGVWVVFDLDKSGSAYVSKIKNGVTIESKRLEVAAVKTCDSSENLVNE
jgi:antitoxin component YwqK of YwqJK toxin-antitoxin module